MSNQPQIEELSARTVLQAFLRGSPPSFVLHVSRLAPAGCVRVSLFPKHLGDLQFALEALTEILAVHLPHVLCLKTAILFDEAVDCHAVVILIGSLLSTLRPPFKQRVDIPALPPLPFLAFRGVVVQVSSELHLHGDVVAAVEGAPPHRVRVDVDVLHH